MEDDGEGRKRGEGDRGANSRQRAMLIVAIAHPVRRRMLRMVIDSRELRSPAQLGRELDHRLGMVAYHARILRQCGALKPAGEQTVRRTVEHFYTTTIEDDPPIETLLEETREFDENAR